MTGQIAVEPFVYVELLFAANENHEGFPIEELTGWVM